MKKSIDKNEKRGYTTAEVHKKHQKGVKFMTDRDLLGSLIRDSGLKKTYIAKQLGISRTCLGNLLSGKSEFKESQMHKLCTILNLDDGQRTSIFFANVGA